MMGEPTYGHLNELDRVRAARLSTYCSQGTFSQRVQAATVYVADMAQNQPRWPVSDW